MTWFESLTGFREGSPEEVRAGFVMDRDTLVCRVNGRRLVFGRLEIPSLATLRARAEPARSVPAHPSVLREVVGDAKALHADPANADAVFQVASQFNLLEMVSPQITPEHGIGRYESDPTQGPACAIACGAGTIYRNYFVPVGERIGQSAECQIDCLADVGAALGNTNGRLWSMRNGYALPSGAGLAEIGAKLRAMNDEGRDELRGLLRVGIQWRAQVTLGDCAHRVSQVYCSALPVAYAAHGAHAWEPFGRLILEAAFEATLLVAAENARTTGNPTVFLTRLGGGAFGNPKPWIEAEIERALEMHRHAGLDMVIITRH